MGTIRTVKQFLPMLRKTKGRIVLNASILSERSTLSFQIISYSNELLIGKLGVQTLTLKLIFHPLR